MKNNMTTEERINTILSRRGYLLKYEEIPASSTEDTQKALESAAQDLAS